MGIDGDNILITDMKRVSQLFGKVHKCGYVGDIAGFLEYLSF